MREKSLIAFIGLVGSGKTHIAEIIAQRLGAAHIRTDDIRVRLRSEGRSYARAPRLAARERDEALSSGKSAVMDFDAILPKRQRELRVVAKKFRAHFFLIRVTTPEKIILARLRAHRYTRSDLFRNAEEAVRTYFIRRKLHRRRLQSRAHFVINNAQPLTPQIQKIIRKIT